jgi:hypothetical protein
MLALRAARWRWTTSSPTRSGSAQRPLAVSPTRYIRRYVLERSFRSGSLEARRTAFSVALVTFWKCAARVQQSGTFPAGYGREESGLQDRVPLVAGGIGARPRTKLLKVSPMSFPDCWPGMIGGRAVCELSASRPLAGAGGRQCRAPGSGP